MKLYLVSIRWVTTPMNPTLMDGVLSMVGDWIRFNGQAWFVHTAQPPVQIRELLAKHLQSEDNFLIVPVDVRAMDGWAPVWIWNWLAAKVDPPVNPQVSIADLYGLGPLPKSD